MLVVVSDLHLIDSTAGRHNVPPEWFENVFLTYLPALAERKGAQELKVLLMGDIVDLVRTEKWLKDERSGKDYPAEDRPWGVNGRSDIKKALQGELVKGSATEKRCFDILGDPGDLEEGADHRKQTIFARNRSIFDLFKNRLPEKFKDKMGNDFEVEVTYLPGNHDRLCNLYPELRDRLKDALGLSVGHAGEDWWYPYSFEDQDYGVYARHGHEYDPWNFGNLQDYPNPRGYDRPEQLQVSIGDVIATEFAVKIPKLAREMGSGFGSIDELVVRLQEMDNVRPTNSVFEYFLYRFRNEEDRVKKLLDDAYTRALDELLEFELVQNWQSPGIADFVIRLAGTRQHRRIRGFSWVRWLEDSLLPRLSMTYSTWHSKLTDPTKDDHTEAAYKIEKQHWENSNIRYVLYGHTHDPLIHPLKELDDGRQVVYINTGTWRNRILKTVGFNEETQFVPLEQITYLVFYNKDEDTEGKEPDTLSYDMWTGSSMKKLEEKK